MQSTTKLLLRLCFLFITVDYSVTLTLDVFNLNSNVLDKTYDFVIVGGGSAGSVVANRLSEETDWNVLLLEAGGDETLLSEIPIIAPYTQLTSLDWQYRTEPVENACLGMKDQRSLWSRGKALGGSSVINFMLYVRGNRKDYDGWAALGNSGWSYDDVLPYFRKSEDNQNLTYDNTIYHSQGGYLTVSSPTYETPLLNAFIEAGKEQGYNEGDINGESQTVFTRVQGTVRDGARCSTRKAFLTPVESRSNLFISKNTRVTKILIDPTNKTAYGVECSYNGKIYRVLANKEVILSAGTINSPQILMLSGVGPKDELDQHGIPLIQNLKVGHNLMDHVSLGGLNFLINTTDAITLDKLINIVSIPSYALFQQGIYTIKGAVEGLGFVSTNYTVPDYPDIEFHFTSAAVNMDGGLQLRNVHGLSDEFYQKTFAAYNFRNTFGIIPMLLRPKSRGFVKLRSNDSFDDPVIIPNYFKEDADMKTLIEGVKFGFALSQSNAFQAYGSTLIEFPDCAHITKYTDAYWECMIRYYWLTIYHSAGTCKMGLASDDSAVVDSQLRVHGIKNLRVIDISIFPEMVSGNTNAAAVMIGEKGSDYIKEFWRNKTS